MSYYVFAELVLSLVTGIIAALRRDNLTEAAQIVRRLAVAALRASADVDRVTIDWSDPKAVANYIRSLRTFEPIP